MSRFWDIGIARNCTLLVRFDGPDESGIDRGSGSDVSPTHEAVLADRWLMAYKRLISAS